ncbi:hypothetical protein [Xanthomonas graminis]|uniref:hypothetical protein n=1 Tax=Xanthomonas graminis TaxID=3390026 RepID=UPI001F455DAB|nr:hypothetical protein [Xanthomonas translucens]UKE73522.1 hypothetical protein KFS85_00655 [Xanthomonas translucens pv. phleipratensis]
MQKLKRILTCSTSFTSPTSPGSPASPPIQGDAEQGSDRRHVRAASGDARLEALAEKPIRPYMDGVLEGDLPFPERELRCRINTELLPRTNTLLQVCEQLENPTIPEYAFIPEHAVAMDLKRQLEMRSQGILSDQGEQIGGGDDLDQAVGQLEKDVRRYFDSNSGTPPPTLRPLLSMADGRIHVDSPFCSPWPSVSAFVPKTAPVTRPGSHAEITDDVMATALSMVHVDSQSSSAMDDKENLLKTRVGNFLQAIRKDKDVNILVVNRAKENNGNAADLVDALKKLLEPLPNLK